MCNLLSARSFLFVPGDRPERIIKAVQSAAQCVIIDLEDAVAPKDKEMARRHVHDFLKSGMNAKILLRVNGADSPFHLDDLIVAQHPAVSGVVLPKAEAESCAALAQRLQHPVWPLIETARGISELEEIVGLPNLGRLLLGTIDLSLDLGLNESHPAGQSALDMARFQMVVHSRLARLSAPIDGVFTQLNNAAGLQAAAAHAAAAGMGGMMCIHPDQTSAVHQAFMPDAADVEWAQAVLDVSTSEKSSFRFRGEMVDAPVLERAQRIVAAQPKSEV